MPDEIREITAGSGIARIHLPAVYPDEKAAFSSSESKFSYDILAKFGW
jgi:hypothetical protein